ncbi:hypothetical protein PoB_003104800 [Plakobranchus ocellatus]|uniref:Uncharacterized protein n=1 Tax=Plakobranchus ocellatus TaxID=259542 RepID=A0AAV4ADB3_9GAST|nr:hypothetical protein PoB_003104800 [Plakobranchus ocellatus]
MLFNLVFSRGFDPEESEPMEIFGQNVYLSSIFISFESSFIVTLLGVGLSFVFTRTPQRDVDQCTILSEEQQDLILRRQDMTSRRLQGLMELYPFLTRKLSESSVDRDVERNPETSKPYIDDTIPEEGGEW